VPYVIDSSAILAVLYDERGAEKAAVLALGGMISSVIFAEIIMKCAIKQFPIKTATSFIEQYQIEIQPLTASTAKNAGVLKLNKQFWSLSLADCICITMAIEKSATLVTADRAWLDLNLPCPIELIR
jgi:ribonuclease VapC